MSKTPHLAVLLCLALLLAAPLPAAAMPQCDGLIQPAVALKYVGRGFSRFHSGIDLMAPYGSPVHAAADGTVIYAGRYYAYGNMIDIRHADGSVTRYAHLSRFAPAVRPGATVEAGVEIGAIGTSGNAHGAHLHFEVRIDGHPVDPAPFIHLAACVAAPAPDGTITAHVTVPPDRTDSFVDARPGGLFE
jgi:hypothetical protein